MSDRDLFPEPLDRDSARKIIDDTFAAWRKEGADLVATILDRTAEPWETLHAVRRMGHWIEEQEERLVSSARAEGASWSHIGGWLGMSKQAAWQKHRDPEDGGADD